MPKEIKEIKDFLYTARRADAKAINIKKTGNITKFKIRGKKYVYTLKLADADRAEKVRQSLPPNVKVEVVGAKGKKKN